MNPGEHTNLGVGGGHPHGANGSASGTTPAFTLRNEPVENLQPLRVVVVGAGFSGIVAAIRIPEKLRNVDLTVYEKNEGLGGVWWLNNYPGVACDIPSHSYQYSFAPNPNWSNLYAPGAEIRKYLEDVAEKYGATRFIKTRHEVKHAAWDDEQKLWKIKVQNLLTGDTIEDSANVFITARGQLNDLKWPDIPGLDSFQGKMMHSGAWDKSYDFRNKKIAIIGNGSSAIQIIPSLQKIEGTTLSCFMRSPTWISGEFGDQAMMELGLDPKDTAFTPEQQQRFASDPSAYLAFRKAFESSGNTIHDSTILHAPMQIALQSLFRDAMAQTLSSNPPLAASLIPTFAPGFFDVLICATGYHVSSPPPFPILGRGGLPLSTRWAARPETYLSLAVDGFPNLLMLFGPNSAIGFGSLTRILEAETDYLVRAIRKLQKEGYASLEPRRERVRDFVAFVDAYFEGTVYMDACRSWYKRRGKMVGLWPGSTLHALEALRSPRWEDWVFEPAVGGEGGNALGWLGNGWSLCETDGDPSWYVNPDEVEVPMEGRPEEGARFKARPWSY
ncbi:hypothetical protein B0T18DRAFT_403175 [Schizothecium vesticola]|uniref:FAD/NAD(P)-binding domain-containing protein n=1 Tax=Schizothecium vesticola TaxID=314040 RepID=A0AA40F5Q6_9PEZI|nr:hypothetical protein B0T18DRAFT_403175 [Schizothecium vesticola]